jgi:hypothetical protein
MEYQPTATDSMLANNIINMQNVYEATKLIAKYRQSIQEEYMALGSRIALERAWSWYVWWRCETQCYTDMKEPGAWETLKSMIMAGKMTMPDDQSPSSSAP